MFIDTTLFNNEFEMLDIRLELSAEYADICIVAEGNRTLSGRSKPYYLTENLKRYRERWGNRLQVVQLDIPENWSSWQIENQTRAYLTNFYADENDDTVVMHSDLDEIVNPELVPDIIKMVDQHQVPVSCDLDMYVYRFDRRLSRRWAGNVIARKYMFDNPATLYKSPEATFDNPVKRKNRRHCVQYPGKAGWHWSWIGDDQTVANKVISCIETSNKDVEKTLDAFRSGDTQSAINHKVVTEQVDPDYPEAVNTLLKQYPYWSVRQ